MPETSKVPEKPRGYEFGPFRVDAHGGAVYRGDVRLPLVPKAVDLLKMLLAARGEIVTRDDLLRGLWPDVVVEEGSSSKLVFQLRQALAEHASAIETVPKRGYRFVGEVRELYELPRPAPVLAENSSSAVPPSPPEAVGSVAQATTLAPAPPLDSRRRWRRFLAAGSVMTLLATGLVLALVHSTDRRSPGSAANLDRRSIAVLPFKNLSDDRGDAYFGEGLAEDILTHLSRVSGLRVVSRGPSAHYQDSGRPLRTIGTELGVGTVLEGSIRRAGGRARITVRLTDTRTGEQLWAEEYDRDAQDVLGVQGDVASKVAGALALRRSQEDDAVLRRGSTSDAEAYDLYLRGTFELDRWGLEDSFLQAAIDHLERAIAVDPQYARAHAQLAMAYARNGFFPREDPRWAEKASREVRRALEIEPGLALPHVVQGYILASWQGNWELDGAIREYLRAQELEPNVGHVELADQFAHMGLEEPALRELGLAFSYDPLSQDTREHGIRIYEWLARFPEARSHAEAWFSEPEATRSAWRAALHFGHAQDVMRAFGPEKLRLWRTTHQLALAVSGGAPSESRALIQSLLEDRSRQKASNWHHLTYDFACTEALLGNPDGAVKWLRETAEGGFPSFLLFSKDPFLDSIRADPGYVKLMAELKPRWEAWRQRYR